MATVSMELGRGALFIHTPRLPQRISTTSVLGSATHSRVQSPAPRTRERRSKSNALVRKFLTPTESPGPKNLMQTTLSYGVGSLTENLKYTWFLSKASLQNLRSYSKVVDSLNIDISQKLRNYIRAGLVNTNKQTPEAAMKEESEKLSVPSQEKAQTLAKETSVDTVPVVTKPRVPFHEIYDKANYNREQHNFEEAINYHFESVKTYYSQISMPKIDQPNSSDIILLANNSSGNVITTKSINTQNWKAENVETGELSKTIDELTGDSTATAESPVKSTRSILSSTGEAISGVTQRLPRIPNLFPSKKPTDSPVAEAKPAVIKIAKPVVKKIPRIPQAVLEKKTKALCESLKICTHQSSRFIRLEDLTQHLFEYPETRGIALEENVIPVILRMRDSRNLVTQELANQALCLLGYVNPVKGRGIRILSLDGGGTRGLYALAMLRELERHTGRRIHEMFDLVCGVSTGALISTLLAVNNVSVDNTEALYKEFSKQLFKQSRLPGITNLLKSHAYYDSKVWEKLLRLNVGDGTFLESMKKANNPKLVAVSTIMNARHIENYVFRNYEYPAVMSSRYRGSMKYTFWESIRASSAAPGYYEDYRLGEHMHIDGGFRSNNPTAIAIHESKMLWPNEHIQCVVSLGTGRYMPAGGYEPLQISSLKDKLIKLVKSATDTEAVHTTLQDMLPPEVYFRFNPYMSEDFSLDETRDEKWDQMQIDIDMYCTKNQMKFQACARTLLQERTRVQRVRDYVAVQHAKHPLRDLFSKKGVLSKL